MTYEEYFSKNVTLTFFSCRASVQLTKRIEVDIQSLSKHTARNQTKTFGKYVDVIRTR